MQKKDVRIGRVYKATVSGKRVRVRLDAAASSGWHATNLDTGKAVFIKTAARLHKESVNQQGSTEGYTAERNYSKIRQCIREQVDEQRTGWKQIVTNDLNELARRFGISMTGAAIIGESLNEHGWRIHENKVTFVEPTEPPPPGGGE